MRNRYFVDLGGGGEPAPWDPEDERDPIRLDCIYFGRAMRAMEATSEASGLTVYLTWDVEALPSYGADVVAVCVGDESFRTPRYADRVRAVFKSFGTRPSVGSVDPRRRGWLGVLVAAEGGQHVARHLPDVAYRLRHPRATVHDIPPGYFNQLDLELVDFDERGTEVYFSGSIQGSDRSARSLRYWLKRPRQFARNELLETMRDVELRTERPINFWMTPSFDAITRPGSDRYSRELMDSRIALVPRGNILETYRLVEAARYGCVVVCEDLPRAPFYDGAPFVRVERWRDLPKTLEALTADPAELRRRHEATLAWYAAHLSPEAVGRTMSEVLAASHGGARLPVSGAGGLNEPGGPGAPPATR